MACDRIDLNLEAVIRLHDRCFPSVPNDARDFLTRFRTTLKEVLHSIRLDVVPQSRRRGLSATEETESTDRADFAHSIIVLLITIHD